MTSFRLLVWVALVAGAELAVRGHLADHGWACHGGAALFAVAVGAAAWPTRARRLGSAAAALLLSVAVADAAWAAWAARPASPQDPPTAPRADLRFDCPPDVALIDVLEPASAWEGALSQAGVRHAIVSAGPGLLAALLDEAPELLLPPVETSGPRASPLGAALERQLRQRRVERRWEVLQQKPPTLQPKHSALGARYRAALLAARRAGLEVVLGLKQPRLAGTGTHDPRILELAHEAHARLARSIAGAYGMRTLELFPDPDVAGTLPCPVP